MPTDNHDAGEDLFGGKPTPSPERNEENPGYETTDVNVGGIVVFLTGLSAFVLIFFRLLLRFMGKVINSAFLTEAQDGPPTKWHCRQQRGPQLLRRLETNRDRRRQDRQAREPRQQPGDAAARAAAHDQQLSPRRASTPTTATRPPPICTPAKICCSSTPAPAPGKTAGRPHPH